MSRLRDKEVVLGVSGGIAAYKAAALCRLLAKAGARVTVVMTASAARLVGEATFKALTGRPVIIDLWQDTGDIPHIRTAEDADLMIVAPATANTVAKLALGLADDALGTIALARRCPLLVAPAMNPAMLEKPQTRHNLKSLAEVAEIVGPAIGEMACGESGEGRMSGPEEILFRAECLLSGKDLAGKKVVVTAGPTREYLDEVRYISNPSTGRMGVALALEAMRRGAEVKLILGEGCSLPPYLPCVRFRSAEDLERELAVAMPGCTHLFMTAAVGDFTVTQPFPGKIDRKAGEFQPLLKPTRDILADMSRARDAGTTVIGFAAEYGMDEKRIAKKVWSKTVDWLAVNDVSRQDIGFGSAENELLLYDRSGEHRATISKASKERISEQLMDLVLGKLPV